MVKRSLYEWSWYLVALECLPASAFATVTAPLVTELLSATITKVARAAIAIATVTLLS